MLAYHSAGYGSRLTRPTNYDSSSGHARVQLDRGIRRLVEGCRAGKRRASRRSVAHTVRSHHAPLHPRFCSRRHVFLHCCNTRTAPPIVDGAYRRAACGFRRSSVKEDFHDERHRRVARSPALHMDAARGRCRFLVTLACHQGTIRACHPRWGTTVTATPEEGRARNLAAQILGARYS